MEHLHSPKGQMWKKVWASEELRFLYCNHILLRGDTVGYSCALGMMIEAPLPLEHICFDMRAVGDRATAAAQEREKVQQHAGGKSSDDGRGGKSVHLLLSSPFCDSFSST